MNAVAVPARSPRRFRPFVIAAVLGGIAVGLRALDSVPPWWLGQPRAPVPYATVFELERQQRTRLLVPFFFPDALVWPPTRIWLGTGQGRPVLLEFERADGSGVGLLLAQTLDGDHPVPRRLLPPVRDDAAAASEPAWPGGPPLRRGTIDGRAFLEVSEVVDGRRVVLRWFADDAVPLVRMARSLRRG